MEKALRVHNKCSAGGGGLGGLDAGGLLPTADMCLRAQYKRWGKLGSSTSVSFLANVQPPPV